MANWYRNLVTLKGDRDVLDEFKAKHLVHDDERNERFLDFNTVIPRPKELEGTEESTELDKGLIVFGHNDSGGQRMLDYPEVVEAGVTDLDGLKELIVKRWPDCVAQAERHLKVKELTGYLNWYDWSLDNWGTKWNSWELEIVKDTSKQLAFRFLTANRPPIPVLNELVLMWPQLDFSCRGYDVSNDDYAWYRLSYTQRFIEGTYRARHPLDE
jgi:hypothetical protein